TGAPIEHLQFEDVNYWEELVDIMEWTKTNVVSVFHICWGAQAALYHHYGIDKYELPKKCSGIFQHKVLDPTVKLVQGFEDVFNSKDSKHCMETGHLEYDATTLRDEYERDVAKGLAVDMPENYFPNNDSAREPLNTWRAHTHLLFSNWLNYYVYQETPFTWVN